MNKLANFVGFQVCWFACVLGAAHSLEWLGPLAVLVWCGFCVRAAPQRVREALALLAVGGLGALVAALELHFGWLEFRGASLSPGVAPAWIVALWIVFASTFESSLRWVTSRPALTVGFALVGSPLSYLGGERLGSLTVLEPRTTALVGVGVLWACALPLAAWCYRRLSARAQVEVKGK
jgi:hypothetical protein